jgi:hypothetical protein
MKDKLSQFGHNFQIKSIVCLMIKQDFMEQIYDILDENYFDNDATKWIVKECKSYYVEYKKRITFDAFKVKLNDVENDILKTTIVETLKEIYKYLEADDLDFVQNKTLDFFKNQKLKNAIMESVNILERNGDIDGIKKIIDEAMAAGTERNFGHEYFEMIEERYAENVRNVIGTPWDIINELIQGGLGTGELGVIVAPAGVGKTWILSAIGAAALKDNKSVVHYTLELNESYVGLRYDSCFTGIANQNLKYHQDDVVKKLESIEDSELIIKYFPTKTATVSTLSAHLQRLKAFGKKIDLVILDYADIMKDDGYAKEVRHQLGNIYDDLRGMAGELEIPIWTASQANRSALDDDVIEAQKIAESYIKIMTADFVMSLSRKIEDKIANTGRFHVIKNRFGPDGITYPAKINTNTGQVEIYEGNSVGGKIQQDKIDHRDRITRKILANKYKDIL